MEAIIAGFADALTPYNMLFVLIGVAGGVLIGAVPGMNGPMAIALCIPLTYYMSPLAAIGFLVGLNKGAFFGGSISAILLRTPGTPEAAATTWDGYTLARQGKGEKALRMALFGSVSGDFLATMVLVFVAAPLAAIAVYMGPPETFALICLALTIIAGLGTKSLARGLVAAAFGIWVAMIGTDPVTAMPRLTFDIVQLERGISLIPVAIGMLAFSEILIQLERKLKKGAEQEAVMAFSSKPEDKYVSWAEYKESFRTIVRSSTIGIGVGAMPGLGAPVASFVGYDQAQKHSKHPEEFGKGRLEGIAAAEPANSAVVGSSLIPLFVLGIPGNLAVAMLMGAFMIHGMMPGPLLFQQNAELMYGVFGSLLLASGMLLLVGLLGLKLYCKAVQIPAVILYPVVIFTCLMGAYLAESSLFDVQVMIVFGVLGYFMRKLDFSYVAFLIGFILAPIWERALQQVIISSQFDPFMFFTRPVAVILMLLTLFVIIKTTISAFRRNRLQAARPAAGG